VQVSACLVDACEDCNCFGEDSFLVLWKVSELNKEHRFKFCVRSKKTATEMLKIACGEECLSRTVVLEWLERFRGRRVS
jgi:hypothetical protein